MPPARPRLLFLSQCLPYPPTSGVTNRTYHILRELQRTFEVSLVPFSRRSHQPDAATRASAHEALSRTLTVVAEPIPVPTERSSWSKLAAHLRSVLSGEVYVKFEYAAAAFGEQLDTAVRASPPDLVHLDSLDLQGWMHRVGSAPIACTHHSIESDLLRLRGRHHGVPLLRPYYQLQATRYLALERKWSPFFASNVMMSELDAERLRSIAPGARTVAIPNGVDLEAIKPGHESEVEDEVIAFLGPAYMYPNRDGMEYFFAEIWPLVLRARPSANLIWIGRIADSDRARFERHHGVRCAGFVEDLERQLAAAACLVVPLRIGGGTRLKILDAWAAGKAVVSTTVGCEGLDTEEGTNILIRDEPHAFAEAIVRVLGDRGLRRGLGAAARRTVETTYGWTAIGEKLNREYRKLLGG